MVAAGTETAKKAKMSLFITSVLSLCISITLFVYSLSPGKGHFVTPTSGFLEGFSQKSATQPANKLF
jgi:hypothetical protein